MADIPEYFDQISLESQIEALLFVASFKVAVSQLAEALEKKPEEIERALESLENGYLAGRGLRLQRHAGRVQLTTAPEIAPLIERFLGLESTSKLSRAALEALSIIAYRQPITRPGVDAIRGVSSDGVMKNLLNKGLIEELGRSEGPGRPIIYGTTEDFLHYFGLASLNNLPPLQEEEQVSNHILKD